MPGSTGDWPTVHPTTLVADSPHQSGADHVPCVKSPLLIQFAIQTAAWGLFIGAVAAIWWASVGLRDVAGAARLEHIVWLTMGLDIGCIAVGGLLGGAAWLMSRRLGGVGAGIAISVQGLALLVLDMQFATTISR